MNLAIIAPRYGEVFGGAELFARWLAELLVQNGRSVDILTTTSLDHTRWENDLEEGVERVRGVTVRRFRTDERDLDTHRSLEMAIRSGVELTREEEDLWLRNGASSLSMESFIRESEEQYDLILGLPYLFGVTQFGLRACLSKAVAIPCLHDEPYARLKCVSELLGEVRGIMFNSVPEKELALKLTGGRLAPSSVVGVPIGEPQPQEPKKFRKDHDLDKPFILFIGRREEGKNFDELARNFLRYTRRTKKELDLVTVGSGTVGMSRNSNIIDLKLDWATERDSLYAAATLLCHPSIVESFSIVMMQAWMCETPVVVSARGSVTTYHCEKSGAGLWYENYAEFEEIVDLLLEEPSLRDVLGEKGRKYVEREYSAESVLKRFDQATSNFLSQSPASLASR